jgi:thymidine kinase
MSKIPTIFLGPMGAGKTLSLIQEGRRCKGKTLLIKYSKDKRFTSDPCILQSHDKNEWLRTTHGIMIDDMKEIIQNTVKEEKKNVVGKNKEENDKDVKENKESKDAKEKSPSFNEMINKCDTILIDEAQFIGNIKLFLQEYSGIKNIFLSCLNSSYKQEVFPNLIDILPYCSVEYCVGKCDRCGNPAIFNVRLNKNDTSLVSIGGKDQYETRCIDCLDE